MKIGLLGNMNNNNFALLRYLHDLGVEADLLLMSDDGVGPLAHFSPECDTWYEAKWAQHIKRIPAPNRFISAIGHDFPWNLMFWLKYALLKVRRSVLLRQTRPPSKTSLGRILKSYDHLVGSGITPALLDVLGRRLNVFYPYSSGVEYVGDAYMVTLLSTGDRLKRQGGHAVRNRQIKGIRNAKHVVTGDIGYTVPVFESIGVSPMIMHAPILYRESPPSNYPVELRAILQALKKFDIRFISHTRHRWVNSGESDETSWETMHSKHNQWIVSAYANFRRQFPNVRSVLVLAEYGTDYLHSKNLCRQLGVEKDVLWIQAMPRKYILEIISACDVGIGEFYLTPRMTWGGVGWEIMACGKPLVQGYIFGEGEYTKLYGIPPPPLCAVSNSQQLNDWLIHLGQSLTLRAELGKECQRWFDTYNGIGLARRWMELIAQ